MRYAPWTKEEDALLEQMREIRREKGLSWNQALQVTEIPGRNTQAIYGRIRRLGWCGEGRYTVQYARTFREEQPQSGELDDQLQVEWKKVRDHLPEAPPKFVSELVSGRMLPRYVAPEDCLRRMQEAKVGEFAAEDLEPEELDEVCKHAVQFYKEAEKFFSRINSLEKHLGLARRRAKRKK